MTKDEWFDMIELKLPEDQYELIAMMFGEEAAKGANYGWGVGGDDDSISYATKVYLPEGAQVITSDVTYPNTIALHHWEVYGPISRPSK